MATGEFVASGFFVLRAPLLPFDELLAWGDGLEAPGAVGQGGDLAGAVEVDRARLRDRLGQVVARPEVRDALTVASPDLDASIRHWLEDPDSERGRRVERALVRYVTRMAANPTPFGLFAGCSTGTIGHGTNLTVEGWAAARRHSRLDLEDLEAVAEALARDPGVRERVRHRPNSTLYRTAGRLQYVELRRRGRERSHHLVAVIPSRHLDAALAAADDGARPAEIAAVVAGGQVTAEAAAAFVAELIDEQVLVPDLAAPVTGPEPLDGLIEQLEAIPEASPAAATLARARAGLAAIDAGGLGADPASYQAVAETVAGLLPGRSPVIRVDMVRPAAAASLGPLVVEELLRGVQLLRHLTRPPRDGPLERFAAEFVERYGKREVPLIEAVEGEAGVGLAPRQEPGGEAAPLLRGLDFPSRPDELVPWGPPERLLLDRLVDAAGEGRTEITLTPAEVGRLGGDLPELPDAFAVVATIVAPSAEAVDRGRFLVAIDRASGPSGARALARFCHADPVLRQHVDAHHRAEEALDADAVVAEVVHVPEGHLGNVVTRPVLREAEISYLARSGAPAASQLPVSDLLVSVRQGRVVLRSRRLGRRVVPRVTTAHNDERGANLYRFLAQVQADGKARRLALDGGPLADAPFVPRLRVGRVVLWPARWRLTGDELTALSGLGDAELFEAVAALRERRRLPRFVVLQDDQSRLLADLDNLLSVASLAQALSGRDQAVLTELAAAPDGLCVEGPDGHFTHEIIVPFVRAAPLTARRAWPLLAAPPFSHTYPPGSEWLYAKLYSGPAAADRVLLEAVAPVAAEAVASGAADRWSFLRFADPEWHLRVRFHGDAGALWDQVLPSLRRALAPMLGEDGLVWRLQLDTFERAVDWSSRVEGVEVAEGIYQADSEAVVAILTLLEPGDQGEDERWRLSLAGVARLLDDLGLTGSEKQAVADDLRVFFAQEFRADGRLRRQIGDRFRAQRAGLQALIDRPWDRNHPLAPGFEILDRRSEVIAPLVPRLAGLQADGTIPRSLHTVATSLAHLHVDRLLRSAQRAQELVLYDFLARLYQRPDRGS